MTDTEFIQTGDGRQILFLLREDLDDLERKTEFPYGLRRGGERAPFSLPEWHPRIELLGHRYSTSEAKDRYYDFMRAVGLAPITPIENRVYLYIDQEEARAIGAGIDRDQKLFYINRHRPDAQELISKYATDSSERAWSEKQAEIAERRRKQMEYMDSSLLYLQARIIKPERGKKRGHVKPSRRAMSYFKDLVAMGRINNKTSQAELFNLILDELAVWGIHVTPDCIRHLDGIDWKEEARRIGTATAPASIE